MTIDEALARWQLARDGAIITTHSSLLVPVRRQGEPAMLKITQIEEEQRGGAVLAWWAEDGAARVYARAGEAILLERATGDAQLADLVADGYDDEATRIICGVARRLHAPRQAAPPTTVVPLARWFAELWPAATRYGGILAEAAAIASTLLADQRDVVVLHGDLHHGNVLDFGPRGWLAIDPKGLLGERAFDFVNLLRNPDEATATAPGRFARQATAIAEAAGVDRVRLLQWTLAFAGLSAAWILGDGNEPALDLAIARLAADEWS